MNKFKNCTAVVTGAASGIGRALALELAKQGANLALSDVNDKGLAQTAALIKESKSDEAQYSETKVVTHKLDVSDQQAFASYADLINDEFGQINLVINNAGVGLNTGTFEQTTLEEFEWLMSINFSGVLYGSKSFLPHLMRADWGHIVNISSLFGIISVGGQSAYNASKFAVRGLTEALRQELDLTSPTVSCTCVHPGGIKTNIVMNSRASETPLDAHGNFFLGSPEEFEQMASTDAESAAQQILTAVKKDKRRLLIGRDAKLLDWVQRHFPNRYPTIFFYLLDFLKRRLNKQANKSP